MALVTLNSPRFEALDQKVAHMINSLLAAMSVTAALSLSACITTPKSDDKKPDAHLVFEEQNLTVDAYWVTKPKIEVEQVLRLEVRDAKTHELIRSPLPISASVWMKTHSYGPIEPSVSEVKSAKGETLAGVYEVTGIYFLAEGQWQLRVYLDNKADPKPMKNFIVDLGQEKLNPINDPKSPMYQMMNKSGGGMDHTQHMKMMQEAAKAEADAEKAKAPKK